MTAPKALLVEDSAEFVLLGRRLLSDEGFDVAVANDGATAVEAAREHAPELIVLDVSLPVMDGIEVCRRVREFSDAYIVMVTARGEEVDRVLGLAVGADDYVTKPFSARELSLRIKAMRRRPRPPVRSSRREFDGLSIDTDAREVLVDGELVALTRIEYGLLEALSGEPRRSLSRRQLMQRVWGGDWFGDDHVVDVHMANLRRKIGEPASRPRHVRTVRGYGYRFDP